MSIPYFNGRRWLPVVFLAACPSLLLAQATPNATQPALNSIPSQASYGIGRQIAADLAQGGLDGELLDVNALVLGIRDALSQTEARISQEQFQKAFDQVQQIARQKMQQKMNTVAEKNRRDGPAFVAKYKALDGVQQTPSGLMYKVIKKGNGPSPKDTDIVKTHYRGRLVDGSEFDSSYKRNEPATFPVNKVIPGWTEALKMMKVGDHWQLVIPANLAYGPNGSPPVIGPDAVLIFDIELLGIEPAAAAPSP